MRASRYVPDLGREKTRGGHSTLPRSFLGTGAFLILSEDK